MVGTSDSLAWYGRKMVEIFVARTKEEAQREREAMQTLE